MLLNSYTALPVDGKNNVLRLPLEFAKNFAGALVCTVSPADRILNLYPESEWEVLERELVKLPLMDPNTRKLKRFIIGHADDVIIDSNQKLAIPSGLVEFAGITSKATVLSVGNKARILLPERWDRFRANPNSFESLRLATSVSGNMHLASNLGFQPSQADLNALSLVGDDLTSLAGEKRYREIEDLVGEAISRKVSGVVEVMQYQKDGGVDIVCYIPSGENSTDIVYVQCKGGEKRATATNIRELIGVVARDGATTGLFMSTAGYTNVARKEAAVSKIKIDLVDAYKLAEWIEDRNHLAIKNGLVSFSGQLSSIKDKL